MRWTVYVLVSSRRTYVGITTDVERRLAQHNGKHRGGAKSTRAGGPWRIGATWGPFETRGDALRVEHRIKRLHGRRRLASDPLGAR
jgi:putative endonuclease